MQLSSPAFRDGEPIPRTYTCDGADGSPPLAWHDVPAIAQALALIVDDPDAPAGTWVHWAIWNLPPRPHELPAGVPPLKVLPTMARQGTNDFGRLGWGGPCPPSGTHRYYFRLYALDAPLTLGAGSDRAALDAAIRDHVVAQATLMGTYQRAKK